jgi:hypothetical protein
MWARAYEPELNDSPANGIIQSPENIRFDNNPSPMKLTIVLVYDVQGVLVCHPTKQHLTGNEHYDKSLLQYHIRHAAREK